MPPNGARQPVSTTRAVAPPAPEKVLDDLAATLRQLTLAHADLCDVLDQQHAAMKRFDTEQMTRHARKQEQSHRRILKLESDRRRHAQMLARAAGLGFDVTLVQLAGAYPDRREELLELRRELHASSRAAAERGRRCQRIAASVLSHLNSALRMVTRSSVYQSTGNFTLPPPIHRLEAVG